MGSRPEGVGSSPTVGRGALPAPYNLRANELDKEDKIMPARKSGGRRTIARSSVTGRFVKKSYAKTHKRTTEVQRVRMGKRKKAR
jgi:hypothetical protein